MPTAKEVVADILDEAICLTRDDAIEMIEALSERGYVIVPKEPTDEMLERAKPYMDSYSSNLAWWDAMIGVHQ